MDHIKQRLLGVRKALSLNAEKTLGMIRDQNSGFEDILKVAIGETGLDATVQFILQNEPEWAYQMLRYIQDVGCHRDALIKKASESPEWAINTLRSIPDLGSHQKLLVEKAGKFANPIGDVSGFNLLDQGWYNCEFTIYWANNGKTEPKNSYPDWDDWKWSSLLSGGGSGETKPVSDFGLPKAAPQPGNEVWMYMWVEAGDDVESPFHFTYNPNSPDIAYYKATGSTKSTSLSLTKIGESETKRILIEEPEMNS